MAKATLRTTQQEAKRLLCEMHPSVRQGYCGPSAPFHRRRDNNDGDDTDGDRGAAGQGVHVYKVVVRYRV